MTIHDRDSGNNPDDARRKFIDAMRKHGLELPAHETVIADATFHRCDVTGKGKSGEGDGSYMLNLHGSRPFGWFRNWTNGDARAWRYDKGNALTAAEQRELDRAIRDAHSERDKVHAEARARAKKLWRNAQEAADWHPYCKSKQIKPHRLRMMRFRDGDSPLFVPMRDEEEMLQNLQFIHEDGHKHGLNGGRVHDCHYWITKPEETDHDMVAICEGWATGESIYQATGHAVCMSFGSNNLLPVAEQVRKHYPKHGIVICADDDWKQKGNPGVSAAHEAARAANGLVAIPAFGKERGDRDTDFNDMMIVCGLKAVRKAIDAAVEPDDEKREEPRHGVKSDDEKYDARIRVLVTLQSRAYDDERKAIKNDFGVRLSTIDSDVEECRNKARTDQAAAPAPDIKALAISAREIIESEDVLALFGEECARVIAGEETLTKLLYLSATSRLFDKAMHVALKGPSAAGKSEARKRVLTFFPPEAMIQFTALSEKALLYFKDDFAHKVLSMGEAFSPEEAKFQDYILRELLSEGILRYPVVQKQPDGTLQTITIQKNGPVAFMVTTTRNKLHPENETRMLSIEVDDSAEQTRRVLNMVAVVEGLNREVVAGDFAPWHDYQRWLAAGECRVYLPFSRELSDLIKTTKSVRLRRDFGQLLRGIKAHALLHREHRRRRNNGSIVATIEEDYEAVRALLTDLLDMASEVRMRRAVSATIEVVKELQADAGTNRFGDATGVKVRAIANMLKLDMSATYRRLQAAELGGFLINLEDRPRRPGRYTVTGDKQRSIEMLPTAEDLRQAVEKNRARRV